MTAEPIIDPDVFLHEQLAQASPDLMREMLATFLNALLSAQADTVLSADTATARRSGATAATATSTVTSTPASEPSTWRSRSYGRGPTSRTGCCSGGGAARRPR